MNIENLFERIKPFKKKIIVCNPPTPEWIKSLLENKKRSYWIKDENGKFEEIIQ